MSHWHHMLFCTRLACWKYRMQKLTKIRHLRTTTQLCQAISSQLRHVSTIGKKLLKQQYLPHMSSQYGELRPTSGWDRLASLGHPSEFQRVSRLHSVTAWHSSSGRQPNFAALDRGRHLYSARWPSCWALAHILVSFSHLIYVSAKPCLKAGPAHRAVFLWAEPAFRPDLSAV